MRRRFFLTIILILAIEAAVSEAAQPGDGSAARPLRVILIPADGGTEEGSKADFQPLFSAITRSTGIHFDVKAGQSYAAVIEGMCSGHAEIAWFGAASFIEARKRGCAELLAVDVDQGSSSYYAGIFVRADSPVAALPDLRSRSLAVGSMHSTSSFIYPMTMLLEADVDPIKDLSEIRITGSHANSIKALDAGLVDAAAASFDSFAKAVNQGSIRADDFRVIAKSAPIPNPPLALQPALSADLKARLREALARVHQDPDVRPEMIRGYGGKQVERYDTSVRDDAFDVAEARMLAVDRDLKTAILRKAAQ